MASDPNRKFIGKHFRRYVDECDYIKMAHAKCAPMVTAMVDAARAIPDIPEKKGLIGAILEFSRATEAHIANLEFEMTNVEFEMSKLYMRNLVLEEEVKRCHAKIDLNDDINISMVKILEMKLKC